jgi:hypothetical protein
LFNRRLRRDSQADRRTVSTVTLFAAGARRLNPEKFSAL